jgi:hypothetical protein
MSTADSADQPRQQGSSPYATGGGGVLLEHAYAASALASVLMGQPVDGLGDEFVPTQVRLQQEAFTAVDDVVIRGVSDGGTRTLMVACRRRPRLIGSDKKRGSCSLILQGL